MRTGFQTPCGNAVKRHHGNDIERKYPSILVWRSMIQLLVHERRFGQKGKHRTETESLEKQGNNMGAIINDIYTSGNLEVNDIDFFEVINSKL